MAATITFRQTKAGEWVAFGPAALVQVGQVQITKKSGEVVTRTVERVGRDFTTGGATCRYGYLAAETSAPRHTATTRTAARTASHECESCGSRRGVHQAVDMSGIPAWACWTCDDGSLSVA